MSHKHEHHCEHEVKVCAHCDVAYCTKCSKEWGAPCNLNHYPVWWYQQPATYWPNFTVTGSSAVDTVTINDVGMVGELGHMHN